MSDTAKNTWSTATIAPKCGTKNRALQERLNAVENALMENHHTHSNQQEKMTSRSRQGGYNSVWLVSYTTEHHVSDLHFPP